MRGSFVEDDELIKAFVESLEFHQFFTHEAPPPSELNAGIDPNDWNCVRWRPSRIETPRKAIVGNSRLSGVAFPPLYERLVLTYRWLEVWTHKIRLFSNPPGASLDPLAKRIRGDPVFDGHLFACGYIPFGLDINVYDPVCFNTNKQSSDGDCPVVRFEHEAMLSFDRIGESWVLWPTCRAMMLESIA